MLQILGTFGQLTGLLLNRGDMIGNYKSGKSVITKKLQ